MSQHPNSADNRFLPQPNHIGKTRQVEMLISGLLRVGVLISVALIVLGTTVSFAHHPDYLAVPASVGGTTESRIVFPHTFREVICGLTEFKGRAIVVLGLLVLIATPVLRVAVSILGFAYERDRIYVVITIIVLALLILSFAIGRAEL